MIQSLRNEIKELQESRLTTFVIQGRMADAASPFGANVLTEEYRAGFTHHPIRYNEISDLVDHIQKYQTWMAIDRYSPTMMCQTLDLPLQEWGTNGLRASYRERSIRLRNFKDSYSSSLGLQLPRSKRKTATYSLHKAGRERP